MDFAPDAVTPTVQPEALAPFDLDAEVIAHGLPFRRASPPFAGNPLRSFGMNNPVHHAAPGEAVLHVLAEQQGGARLGRRGENDGIPDLQVVLGCQGDGLQHCGLVGLGNHGGRRGPSQGGLLGKVRRAPAAPDQHGEHLAEDLGGQD